MIHLYTFPKQVRYIVGGLDIGHIVENSNSEMYKWGFGDIDTILDLEDNYLSVLILWNSWS